MHANLSVEADIIQVQNVLRELKNNEVIQEHDGYYGVAVTEEQIKTRKQDEARFDEALSKVMASSRIISRFPFVRGLAISGGISKGVMKEDGDVDFFITTSRNRLWICRSLLVINKKLLRFNSKKYFCVNYFVDVDSLHIPDHNLFTATEIAYLIPTYDGTSHAKLLKENDWHEAYVPNFRRADVLHPLPSNNNIAKYVVEKLLSGWLGNKLDRLCMRVTLKQWQRKFPHFTQEEFDLAMRSKRNVSKHHPGNFQIYTLKAHKEAIERFEQEHGMSLL